MQAVKWYKTKELIPRSNAGSRLAVDVVSCELVVKNILPHKSQKVREFQGQTVKDIPKQTEDSPKIKIHINLCPILAAAKTREAEDSDCCEPDGTVEVGAHCDGRDMIQKQQVATTKEQQAAAQQEILNQGLKSDVSKATWLVKRTSLPAISKPYQKCSSYSVHMRQTASPCPLPLINISNQSVLPSPSSVIKTHGIIRPFPKLLQQHNRSQTNCEMTFKRLSQLQLPDAQIPSADVLLEKVKESARKWEKEKVVLARVDHLSLAGALQSLREGLLELQDPANPFVRKMVRCPRTEPSRFQEMNVSMKESALKNNHRLAVEGKQPVTLSWCKRHQTTLSSVSSDQKM
ncbi:uncharacterized protein LOC108930529 [Scleropages formosus]|uniref:uncharacterized protein LOC108930529 n=1 Tax=Scleropages formosus TaxID=113540 RepID=UPI000878BA32|nr:uncharacterized protein LOC108930529 [Scleropages formosus]